MAGEPVPREETRVFEAEVELLDTLLSRGPPDHPHVLSAAQDPRLSDDALFALALRGIENERADVEPRGDHGALVVLQARTTPEVLQRCLDDLRAAVAARRHLAAATLREFGGLNDAPHAHSSTVVRALESAVTPEQDADTLDAMLRAIGWQRVPEGESVLLRFVADSRDTIRSAVADSLLMAVEPGGLPSAAVLDALHALSRDESEWIRESVFWDVAESPSMFHAQRERFLASAKRAVEDCPAEEGVEARRALQALSDLDETSGS